MRSQAQSKRFESRHGAQGHGRGFTLIEVLIATAIFATVLIALNTVFYGALHLQRTTSRVVEETIPINHALSVIKGDLRSMLPPGGVLAGPIVGGMVTGTMGTTLDNSPGGTLPGMAGGFPSLQIYTSTGITDDSTILNVNSLPDFVQPWPDIQRVAYYLRNPMETTNLVGKELVRVVTRNLLPLTEELPFEQPLLEGVENIEFLFYDGTSWLEWWDSTTLTNPLHAIKIQVELVPDNRNERLRQPPIELVVPVVVQASTNQPSASGTSSQTQSTATRTTGTSGGTSGGATGGSSRPSTQPTPPSTGTSTGGGRSTGGAGATGGGRTGGGGGTTGGGRATGGGR